jgi:probable phosphoglycerate mutase
MKILVLRHAKTDESIVASWTPQPLLPEGVEHAKKIVNTLFKKFPELNVKKIISSDLTRCAQTAQIMANEINVPLVFDESFRGFNIGNRAGVSHYQFLLEHPVLYYKEMGLHDSCDGGETPYIFFHRVAKAFQELIKNPLPDGDLILVTHRSVLDVLYSVVNRVKWKDRFLHYELEYLMVDANPKKTE